MGSVLDILICTLPARAERFAALEAKLQAQIDAEDLVDCVSVLSECDDGELSIGAKRNRLLDRASADYVCFVDDDDDVAPLGGQDVPYVRLMVDGIRRERGRRVGADTPVPDCVGIVGAVRRTDGTWKSFKHSMAFAVAETRDCYFRPPNHLNPVRLELIRSHGIRFTDKSHGEDSDYAGMIRSLGLVKSEQFVEECAYWYYPSPRHRVVVPGEAPAAPSAGARSDPAQAAGLYGGAGGIRRRAPQPPAQGKIITAEEQREIERRARERMAARRTRGSER